MRIWVWGVGLTGGALSAALAARSMEGCACGDAKAREQAEPSSPVPAEPLPGDRGGSGEVPTYALFPRIDENTDVIEYFAQYEHTRYQPLVELWLGTHEIEVWHTEGETYQVYYGAPEVPLADDVTLMRDLFKKDPEVAGELADALWTQESLDRYTECFRAWRQRGGTTDRRTEWNAILDVEARNGHGRVTGVTIPPEQWPAEFDDPIKQCILHLTDGVEWTASRDYTYRIQKGGCVPHAPERR